MRDPIRLDGRCHDARFALFASLVLVVAAISVPETNGARPAPEPWIAVWSGSSTIAFGAPGGHGGIYVIRSDGSGLRRLTAAGGGDGGLAVSPDGRTLLFAVDFAIHRIGIDGRDLRRIGTGSCPAWSPDGDRIAFTRNDGVYLMQVDGTGVHKLVTTRYSDSAPCTAWSPNGKKLAYVACSAALASPPCEHQYGYDVYVIGVDGSEKHKVTRRSGFPQCPAWSSAGKLAFLASGNPLDAVAVVQAGGGLRTFRPGGCPSWAPGGRRFAVPAGPGVGIALMNADGSGRRRITIRPDPNAASGNDVAWSADGRSLAIVGGVSRGHLYVVNANGRGFKKLL